MKKFLVLSGKNSKNFNKALNNSRRNKYDYKKEKEKSLKQLEIIMKNIGRNNQ